MHIVQIVGIALGVVAVPFIVCAAIVGISIMQHAGAIRRRWAEPAGDAINRYGSALQEGAKPPILDSLEREAESLLSRLDANDQRKQVKIGPWKFWVRPMEDFGFMREHFNDLRAYREWSEQAFPA